MHGVAREAIVTETKETSAAIAAGSLVMLAVVVAVGVLLKLIGLTQ